MAMPTKIAGRPMHYRAMIAAWQQKLPLNERAVLTAFAEHGVIAFPAIDRIAERIGASEQTVRRSLRRLVAGGFMQIERKGGGAKRPTVYRIDVAKLEENAERLHTERRPVEVRENPSKLEGIAPPQTLPDVNENPANLAPEQSLSVKNLSEGRAHAREDHHPDPNDSWGTEAFCAGLLARGEAERGKDQYGITRVSYANRCYVDELIREIARSLKLDRTLRPDWSVLLTLVRQFAPRDILAKAKEVGGRANYRPGPHALKYLTAAMSDVTPSPLKPSSSRRPASSEHGDEEGGASPSPFTRAPSAPAERSELKIGDRVLTGHGVGTIVGLHNGWDDSARSVRLDSGKVTSFKCGYLKREPARIGSRVRHGERGRGLITSQMDTGVFAVRFESGSTGIYHASFLATVAPDFAPPPDTELAGLAARTAGLVAGAPRRAAAA